jgi:hypothetical protein
MGRAQRLLARMRANPLDWRIDDFKVLAEHFGVVYRQQGTSHVVFRVAGAPLVTVPAARPVKPVYVRQFLAMIEQLEANREEEPSS